MRLVRQLFFGLVAAFAVSPLASAQIVDLSGDWRAMSHTGQRLAFQIDDTPTFDSLDDENAAVPLTLNTEGRHVSMAMGTARYEAEISADGASMTGTWRRGDNEPRQITFERGVFAPFVATPDTEAVAGDWRGVMSAGAATVRIALQLGERSRFASPDEGASGIIAHMSVAGRRVSVSIPRASAVFEGDLSEDGARIVGEWRQATARIPLVLERGAFEVPNRPQTPVAPLPYREEEVGYDNTQRAGVHFAGTLTLPQGDGPFPAVLLITGSGPQDRNESLMGHQPFLVIADYLTRRGFAVLRVDDRGVGGSRGATRDDTYADYATDVEAGVAYLRTRREIDAQRIALLGHSEGGLLAPVVAARDPTIAGIIMLAGPGVSGAEVMEEQARAIMRTAGATAEQVDVHAALQRAIHAALVAAPDEASARIAVTAVISASPLMQTIPAEQVDAQVTQLVRPWYRAFVAYDPAPTLRSLRVPVLALLAERDVQVVAAQNEPALRAAFADNGRARVVVMPEMNHLFQTATTGSMQEYTRIEETIAPAALDAMGDWLAEVLQERGRE